MAMTSHSLCIVRYLVVTNLKTSFEVTKLNANFHFPYYVIILHIITVTNLVI